MSVEYSPTQVALALFLQEAADALDSLYAYPKGINLAALEFLPSVWARWSTVMGLTEWSFAILATGLMQRGKDD